MVFISWSDKRRECTLFFIGCLTPRGSTIMYCQLPYQLETHRPPLLKYLAWSCDHSSSDSRDRGCACRHPPYHGTSGHLLSHASYLSRQYGAQIGHYVLFPGGPYWTSHGFQPTTCWPCCSVQLSAANRCTILSENKHTPPLGAKKREGHTKSPSRLTGPRFTAS